MEEEVEVDLLILEVAQDLKLVEVVVLEKVAVVLLVFEVVKYLD